MNYNYWILFIFNCGVLIFSIYNINIIGFTILAYLTTKSLLLKKKYITNNILLEKDIVTNLLEHWTIYFSFTVCEFLLITTISFNLYKICYLYLAYLYYKCLQKLLEYNNNENTIIENLWINDNNNPIFHKIIKKLLIINNRIIDYLIKQYTKHFATMDNIKKDIYKLFDEDYYILKNEI